MKTRLTCHLPILIFLTLLLLSSVSHATPEFAEQTGFVCRHCHAERETGGKLTTAGEDFREDLKVKGRYHPLRPAQRIIRLIVGYLHLLTAIAWFGTILYVHILLKPAYAAKGLPKGELILGWISIILLSVTGALLTLARIPTLETFITTRFGILLGIKILLFLIMATTAVIVTFIVGPRLRKKRKQSLAHPEDNFSREDLLHYDGKEGRPAYIAYREKVYNVSSSRLWKDGAHLKKHAAGDDLTDLLKTAPHGEEKIFLMPEVGKFIPSAVSEKKPTHEKVFYFMAYMNLFFVFVITFIIALWRWG
jgi:predicted heme/steroid binding protein